MIARPLHFSSTSYLNPDFPRTYLGVGFRIGTRALAFGRGQYVGSANFAFFSNNGPHLRARALRFSSSQYVNMPPPKTFIGNMFTWAILARQYPGNVHFFYQTEIVRQAPLSSSIFPTAYARPAFIRWQIGEISPEGAEFLFNNWNAQRA